MVKDYPPQKQQPKKVLHLHHDLGMPPLLWCCFAHVLILEYPDHHQYLISSSLYYPGPRHKISSQSVHNFWNNVVHRQTDRQTNKQTNATKNITSFAKEVKNGMSPCYFFHDQANDKKYGKVHTLHRK